MPGGGEGDGTGGSISGVTITGDIGDFTRSFGWDTETGMGGISSGLGGQKGGDIETSKTGSVTNVSATRIANIIAGRPDSNAITEDNAVTKITGLMANVLGVDVNENGSFDFTDAGGAGFNFGDGDIAIDGLVLVKTGGFAVQPVQPLKIVFV